MVKHTQKKWKIEQEYYRCNDIITAGGKTICKIFDQGKQYDEPDPEEAKANAILIAEAPELLAACKEAKAYILELEQEYGFIAKIDNPEAFHTLRAAISKAEPEADDKPTEPETEDTCDFCRGRGYALTYNTNEDRQEIQKCDECGIYKTDAAALADCYKTMIDAGTL